jgi:hypothetical protein
VHKIFIKSRRDEGSEEVFAMGKRVEEQSAWKRMHALGEEEVVKELINVMLSAPD